MRFCLLLLFSSLCLACNQPSRPDLSSPKKQIDEDQRIRSLLLKAKVYDSTQITHISPFLFFKSGYLFGRSSKFALVITIDSDTAYGLQLFKLQGKTWILKNRIYGLEAFQVQFDTKLCDFNFDGIPDLFIQSTASNRNIFSRGHLLIFDPKTESLQQHPEARYLANLRPDKYNKMLESDSFIGFNDSNYAETKILTHKWVNGRITLDQIK